jgi:hypothetical protein
VAEKCRNPPQNPFPARLPLLQGRP